MEVGYKFKADSEKQRYTVQAFNDRFVIMTKPFNLQKTYMYTIADLDRKVRGAVDLIFGLPEDVDNTSDANTVLAGLYSGEYGVSYRNCVPLSDDELMQLNM